jgi:hypothetical protein
VETHCLLSLRKHLKHFASNAATLVTKAKIAEFILIQQLSLLYVLNVDKGFMMNANLDESFILNKMLINCIIFKEMVFGISIHRTLCGGDSTM